MQSLLWYKNAVFYEVYVRAFYDSNGDGHGDLKGLTQKLDYIKDLGIDCLWLLPIYPSPLKDDGYDITDYYNVHPDYGTLQDFKELLEEVHRRGLRLIIDLVLNHTSDAHPWFLAARADPASPYRDFYVWSDTDQRYRDARVIFLDTERSNWTWDELAGQYYWHRFYSCQPDLNFDNSRVQDEMLNVVKFWLDIGVDGFRVDAVPYLYERDGTNCENLPETHAYLKRLRRFVEENYPERILLCEANQWPHDVREYFGDGDEFHMAFNFPLMPRVFMALKQEERTPIVWALEQTPPIPAACQWTTFLRNHDELTLEMVTPEERVYMWEQYAPHPRMRQNLGIRRRLAPLLDSDRRKMKLAFSLIFTLSGSPIIYYGDEIAMGDHIWLEDRNGLRTPMQWDNSPLAGFTTGKEAYAPIVHSPLYGPANINVMDQQANDASIWSIVRKMIAIRKKYPVIGNGALVLLSDLPLSVAGYIRRNGDEGIVVVNHLKSSPESIELPLPDGYSILKDLLTGQTYRPQQGNVHLTLEPYQCLWLSADMGS